MSALARYFSFIGKAVYGYDRTKSDLTLELENEGIEVSYSYDIALIPQKCRDKENTLVVYTPAVPMHIPLMKWFKENDFHLLKRSQVLGLLTITRKGLCVAGTHGKTTVSTMLSHLLKHSWLGCSAFLGGISLNYNTNLLVSTESNYVVIEADEYDRSFHQLKPHVAVITSLDADHLDIYGDYNTLKESFEKFTSLIQPGGKLLIRKGTDLTPNVADEVELYEYSLNEPCDFYADKIRIEKGNYVFDFVTRDKTIKNIMLGVPGKINLENSVAALAVAHMLGASDAELSNALMSFRGIRRRFQCHINNETRIYIDDYAHHPREIEATITSVKEMYPDKKLTVVFQPHLFTRTRDFADGFAESLSLADELVLLDIYPAREEPIAGVNAEMIFKNVKCEKTLIDKSSLISTLKNKQPELLITMGAGDIGEMVKQITEELKKLNA